MYKKIFILSAILIFSAKDLVAKDIPIIVIAPSKKPQSVSTVGTSVVVLDEEFLKEVEQYLKNLDLFHGINQL